MRNCDNIVPECRHTNCHHQLYTGKCLDACLKRYRAELGIGANNIAYWRHRGAHNDYIWVECSNCGFRVENYKAVVFDCSDTKFKDVKYKFCPICGKEMKV
jgi:hypothetical protein